VAGDIAKAFVAGADFVMIGGMLAGHKECPGIIDIIDDKKVMRFSGMAAKESQQDGVPEYGVEEGKTVYIKYKGDVSDTITNIEGGLRSTATYINANSISEFYMASFIKTNVQENNVFGKH
jgi:GMP reductase